jgi:hypothetical protein
LTKCRIELIGVVIVNKRSGRRSFLEIEFRKRNCGEFAVGLLPDREIVLRFPGPMMVRAVTFTAA